MTTYKHTISDNNILLCLGEAVRGFYYTPLSAYVQVLLETPRVFCTMVVFLNTPRPPSPLECKFSIQGRDFICAVRTFVVFVL